MKKDLNCLAENIIVSADDSGGINANVVVVGGTGCGKTTSILVPKLLHTYEGSLVIPVAKRELIAKSVALMKDRGYNVEVIDLVELQNSTVMYDPVQYLNSEQDIMNFAMSLVGTTTARNIEQYWYDCAAAIIATEIEVVKRNAEMQKGKCKLADVMTFHNTLRLAGSELAYTNLDVFISEVQRRFPDGNAVLNWRTMSGIAPRTASCILSIVNNAYRIFSAEITKAITKKKTLDIELIGKEKTVLFIVTSAMNSALNAYTNLIYADIIRILFDSAMISKEHRLKRHVHLVFDDFFVGAKIKDFASRISVFRSVGIDAMILLQSEAQLKAMYSESESTIILDNMDTYIYLGGTNITTAKSVAERLNVSVPSVLNMPLGQVIIFRRGAAPVISRRYQTYDDRIYKEYFTNGKEEKENVDTYDIERKLSWASRDSS